MIFEISVLELVKRLCCQISDKNACGCHSLGSCVPDYSFQINNTFSMFSSQVTIALITAVNHSNRIDHQGTVERETEKEDRNPPMIAYGLDSLTRSCDPLGTHYDVD